MPDRADVEQRRVRGRIDKNVQIAAVGIFAVKDGAEHARVTGAVGLDHQADRSAVCVQDFGRLHKH